MTIGLLVRIQLASTGLWIDELWLLESLSQIANPLRVIEIPHDNNHLLFNALAIQFHLIHSSELALRLPSLLASVAIIAGAYFWARQHGPWQALCCTLITSFGGAYVSYGSQARGYALMLAFAIWTLIKTPYTTPEKRSEVV